MKKTILFSVLICLILTGCRTVSYNPTQVSKLNVIKNGVEIRWKSKNQNTYDVYWSPDMKQWKKVHKVKGNGNEIVFTHPKSTQYNCGFYKVEEVTK